MSKVSPDQWREISPLLDEALALPEDQCESWLQSLSATKPKLIGLLRGLLEEHRVLSREHFLEFPAAAPEQGPYLRGQTVGPYTLLSPIGQGGMGRVWLAQRSDGRFQRRVAIKFLQFSVATRAGAERFRREGRILGSLTDPHIAELIDAGVMPDGQPYMVLEYVDGDPIDRYCDQCALGINARIRLFLEVLAALAHAHSRLIVHRDIKPSNVLVSKDGQLKLLDFGIAKLLAHEGELVGAGSLTLEAGAALTPRFAAPEQVTGGAITTVTDVYSAGVLLYLLLTGHHPAGPEPCSTATLIKAIVEREPLRPSDAIPSDAAVAEAEKRSTPPERLRRQLRGDLETIALKALKKSPGERYGSIAEFSDDLRRYLNHQPVSARPDTIAYRAVKFARRNQLAVTLAALVVIATIVGVVGTLMQARTARRERDAALLQRDRADRIADFMTGIFKVADPRENTGQSATARELLDKASEDITQNSTLDPELRAQLLHVMGRAYLNLGLFSRAESLFRQGIQTSKLFKGEDRRDTLNMTHDLAWAVMQQGRVAEAENIERKLLETQRRTLGPHDGDTLATMEELAFTVCSEGKGACAEGVELTRKVLERQKQTLGPDARYTLVTMDDLAIMLASANRLDEALKLQQDSLNRHIRTFGLKNLDTVNAMLNLGDFQRDAGREDDAERTLEELLQIENRFLGPNQLETAATKYDLASVLVRKGQKDKALPLLRQALEHGLAPRIARGLPTDPLFASIRNDPEFKALIPLTRKQPRPQSSPAKK